MNLRKYIFLLVCFLLYSGSSYPKDYRKIGVPIIRNFNFYEQISNDNWSIVQDNRGVMFFGTQGGVLEFNDVVNSDLIQIPNTSAVRSLCVDKNGIVYVGARKELGYLKPNKLGQLEYESLVAKLDSSDRNFTEVCKIYNTNEGICFQSFEALYFYKDGKFKVVKSSTQFHFSFYLNNVLYVLERGVGLDKYENGKLLLVPGGQEFANDRIYSILPYSGNKLLITSRERGMFLFDSKLTENNISKISTNASEYLIKNQVYNGVRLHDGTYIFGTLQGGLISVNEQAVIIKILDISNLLEDNKVNDLYVDSAGDLWLAQDRTVSIIELNSPFTVLKSKDGISGKMQSLCKFKESIYAATSLGVFYLDLTQFNSLDVTNPTFKQLDLKSECFNFLKANNGKDQSLFIASAAGLYEVVGNKLKQVLNEYCFFAYQSKSNPNQIIVGQKSGFSVLTKKGGNWEVNYPDNNIRDEIKSIAEDSYGNVWLVTVKEGVYKISKEGLNNLHALGGSKFLYERYDTLSGIENVNFIKIFTYNGNILLGTTSGFYEFDYAKNLFVLESSLNTVLGKLSGQIVDFEQINKQQSFVLDIQDGGGFKISLIETNADGSLSSFSKPFQRLLGFLITSFKIEGDENIWMISNSGIFSADLKSIINKRKKQDNKYNVLIRKVSIGNDSVIFGGTYFESNTKNNQHVLSISTHQNKNFMPELPFEFNTITFQYSYTFNEPPEYSVYSFYLEGLESTWKPWTSETKLVYNNLSEGHYTLHIKAKSITDSESEENTYEFVILPPWYRTFWAYFCYLILFFGFVYMVVQIAVRRLKRAKLILENTVKERTSEIVKQNVEIQKQKSIVEIKNKDITDSINYAKRIQDTILPPDDEIAKMLPNSFILFLPKDILSGDFYWLDEIDNKILVAAVDCTGHGVPGALMSIVGNNILNQAINEHRISKPSKILDELNRGVTNTLRQKNEESKVKDGMDIVLLALDFKNNKLEFSGANNPLYHIRQGVLTEIKGDKFPIGIFIGEEQKHFKNHELELQKGDTIYLFTDGYADQFGGPNEKKFKYNQFKETLLQMQHLPIGQQREILLNTIKSWQGENEQVDDILVLGIKI